MKRVHVIEFEDEPWFPAWLRGCMTNVLVVFMRAIGGNKAIAHQLDQALQATGERAVVDLGSGSGGSMPAVREALDKRFTLTLTDLYPSPDVVARINAQGDEGLRYHPQPVDATTLATAPPGMKTMLNCFHHMRVPQAKAILASAAASKQPLLVYEAADSSKIPNALWWVALPLTLPLTALSCLVFTPLVRPLTWQQLVFTYLIPLIPLFYAWDGQASGIRTYAPDDLRELLADIDDDDDGYHWHIGPAENAAGKAVGVVLFGRPAAKDAP